MYQLFELFKLFFFRISYWSIKIFEEVIIKSF